MEVIIPFRILLISNEKLGNHALGSWELVMEIKFQFRRHFRKTTKKFFFNLSCHGRFLRRIKLRLWLEWTLKISIKIRCWNVKLFQTFQCGYAELLKNFSRVHKGKLLCLWYESWKCIRNLSAKFLQNKENSPVRAETKWK